LGELILMSGSTDGGLTWGTPLATANSSAGIVSPAKWNRRRSDRQQLAGSQYGQRLAAGYSWQASSVANFDWNSRSVFGNGAGAPLYTTACGLLK